MYANKYITCSQLFSSFFLLVTKADNIHISCKHVATLCTFCFCSFPLAGPKYKIHMSYANRVLWYCGGLDSIVIGLRPDLHNAHGYKPSGPLPILLLHDWSNTKNSTQFVYYYVSYNILIFSHYSWHPPGAWKIFHPFCYLLLCPFSCMTLRMFIDLLVIWCPFYFGFSTVAQTTGLLIWQLKGVDLSHWSVGHSILGPHNHQIYHSIIA